jgi:GT2 family glycosyltransferase
VSLTVVDASEDSTPDIIMQQRPERSLVLSHAGPISEARQLGAECCNTPWLLFSDADVAFAPDYFQRLCSYQGWDVVYGSKQSRHEFGRYYRWFGYGQQLSHWLGVPAASGSNLAIRRQIVSAAGGFDPELVCNEDSELVWRLKRAGYRIHFDRTLIV